MKQNHKLWSLIALSAAWSSLALAQSTTSASAPAAPSSTSVAEVKTEESKGFKLPVSLNYSADVFGPRLSNPSDNWTPTDRMSNQNDPTTQDALLIRHNASIGRDLGAGYKISGHAYFNTFMTDPGNTGNLKGFKWRDSYVKLAKGDLGAVNLGGNELSLGGDVRYFAPTSLRSRLDNNRGQARLSLNPNLQFGKSIFSLAAVNYAKFWMHSQRLGSALDGTATGNPMTEWEFYTGPQVTAQLGDVVGVWVLYEAIVQRDTVSNWSNGKDASHSGKALADLEPGATFNIGKNISISPFLNWYTSLPINTTSVNMSLSASL